MKRGNYSVYRGVKIEANYLSPRGTGELLKNPRGYMVSLPATLGRQYQPSYASAKAEIDRLNDDPHVRLELRIAMANAQGDAARVLALSSELDSQRLAQAKRQEEEALALAKALALQKAAPDLLAILQEAMMPYQQFRSDETNPAWVAKARPVLQQATGAQP